MRALILLLLLSCFAGCEQDTKPEPNTARVKALSERLSRVAVDVQANTEALERLKSKTLSPAAVESRVNLPPNCQQVPAAGLSSDWYLVEYTQQSCPPCNRWKVEQRSLVGMPITTIDIVSRPDLARQAGVTSTPSFHLASKKTRKVKYRWRGYTTAKRIRTKAKELQTAQTVYQRAGKNDTRVVFGNHWSVASARNAWNPTRAEVVEHLRNDHGFRSMDLNRMSLEQLLSFHDRAHRGLL